MSHHFDTPTAREDPRINVCDFYLFEGAPGATVMAMTVNPDAGLSAPDSFRDEGLYAFRFDLNEDAREELTFKLRFGAVEHSAQDEHLHVQSFEVRRSAGAFAMQGMDGDIIATGQTGVSIDAASGVRVFAGLAPDLFAGDGVALARFRTAAFQDNRFDPDAFLNSQEPVRAPQCERYRARSPNADDRQRAGEVLGHGVASRPRTGDSSIALGLTPDNTCIHAR